MKTRVLNKVYVAIVLSCAVGSTTCMALKLDNAKVLQHTETVKLMQETTNDLVYPYIGFVIDTPVEGMNQDIGYSYKSALEKIYPDGEWTYINSTGNIDINDTIDVYAIFNADTVNGPLEISFRYYLPNDREYAISEINCLLDGKANNEFLNSIISQKTVIS